MSDLKDLIEKAIPTHEQSSSTPNSKRKPTDQLSAEKERPTKQSNLEEKTTNNHVHPKSGQCKAKTSESPRQPETVLIY